MKLVDATSPSSAPVGVVARLAEVEAALAALAQELEPERVPGHALERTMVLLGRIEHRAGGARLVLAKAAADAGAWKAAGARSAAEHLARQSGTGLGDAKADLAASERLSKLPRARAAAAEGELSKAKIRAVAEGASADPSAESDLVDSARRDDLGAVRDKARKVRHRADQRSGSLARKRYRRRALRLWTEVDGEGHGSWNVPPEYQAAVAAALEPYRAEAFRLARQTDRRHTPEALMADALQLLCLDVLADHDLDAPEGLFDPACPDGPCVGEDTQGEGTSRAGAPVAGASAERPARRRSSWSPPSTARPRPAPARGTRSPGPPSRPPQSSAERRFAERRHVGGNRRAPAQVIVRVDYEALRRGRVEGEETCEIPGIGPVPVSTARMLAEDAILRVIVTKGADVTVVSSDRRYVPADVQHGLDQRDPECVVPGCHARHHLQNHHWRTDYARGGPTEMDNIARVCPHHHDLITYCGWALGGGPGHWQFDPP